RLIDILFYLHVRFFISFNYDFFVISFCLSLYLFFFNDTATTEIYTLSLHDALPISASVTIPESLQYTFGCAAIFCMSAAHPERLDRKSTRLNSSHLVISYAVFCLKKKKKSQQPLPNQLTSIRHVSHSQPSSLTVTYT